jgi:hypothetical protein
LHDFEIKEICKITAYDINRIDKALYRNRKLTSRALKQKFQLVPTIRTVTHYVRRLGWRKIRSKYCQAVSVKNRIERLIYAELCKLNGENFDYKIFIDESTTQSNRNAGTIWYKPFPDETRLGLIGRYKHLLAFHCFGAISRKGASQLLIFDGTLNEAGFKQACDLVLVPFIQDKYPNYHELHMDNAPAHTALGINAYFQAVNINHIPAPAQSPDLNPIELVWHDMKVYIAEQVKPKNALELLNGMNTFWNTFVTVEYCNRKIDHVRDKVLNKIIELDGKATGL